MDKSLVIRYKEYASATELESCDRELLAQAFQAAEGAYAPYSQFHVGAALRLKDGSVVCGNNQENAAYPSGLCAERVAMFHANAAYPDTAPVAIAIAAMAGYTAIDHGIVKLHFELGAGRENFTWA